MAEYETLLDRNSNAAADLLHRGRAVADAVYHDAGDVDGHGLQLSACDVINLERAGECAVLLQRNCVLIGRPLRNISVH